MRYCLQAPEPAGPVTDLISCDEFRQRILAFDAASAEQRDEGRDEVLYVLAGTGRVTVGDEPHAVEPGYAVFVARGTAWQVDEAAGLRILSVLVEEPLPAGATHTVLAGGEHGIATAGREFDLLARPENGCASVTQFVGHIPIGRAPDHFHLYDEVVYVLAGEGAFHVGDESAELRPGACIHLPARLVHCLENFGPEEMRVLGVFRPAGSPAEAYYPDGSAAAVPVAG
jgi:mannose-6-phosphate isomerase-like protein (cupin superfamily)